MRRGFTLLEVLVAVAVLGLVIVLLDQGVAFGIRATAAQQGAEDRHGDVEAVDRAIRRLIAEAEPGVPPEPAPFHGTASALTLVSALPGRPERVEALLFAAGDGLRLRWTKRRHVALFGPPPAAEETVLLTGIRGVNLAYSDGTGWASTWTADRLPRLVRVTLRFDDDAKRRWPPIEAAPAREALGR